MHNYLRQIINEKKKYIDQLYQSMERDKDSDLSRAYSLNSKKMNNKSFQKALQNGRAVIAEIKRKSPSKDLLAVIENPIELVAQYQLGGCVAISVLTDTFGFNGTIQDLKYITTYLSKTPVVVLRKDFILDPIQLAESVINGADAVLLIVGILKEKTAALYKLAQKLNLDVVVEVHNSEETQYALSIGAEMIGVNNRDLNSFEVDTENANRLIQEIPSKVVSIAESGIDHPKKAIEYFENGYHAVLIGEALVKAESPAKFIQTVIHQSSSPLYSGEKVGVRGS